MLADGKHQLAETSDHRSLDDPEAKCVYNLHECAGFPNATETRGTQT